MIQGGQDFCFTLKAREPFRIRRDSERQDLDRDLALQLGATCQKHLAHAAFAYLSRDVVDAEAGAWSETQVADYMGQAGARR